MPQQPTTKTRRGSAPGPRDKRFGSQDAETQAAFVRAGMLARLEAARDNPRMFLADVLDAMTAAGMLADSIGVGDTGRQFEALQRLREAERRAGMPLSGEALFTAVAMGLFPEDFADRSPAGRRTVAKRLARDSGCEIPPTRLDEYEQRLLKEDLGGLLPRGGGGRNGAQRLKHVADSLR